MADAKIEIKVGTISFSGEGSEGWLATQFEKLVKNLPELAKVAPQVASESATVSSGAGAGAGATASKAKGTLAAFLAAKGAKTNQTRKFLATAIWLHDTGGKTRLATSDVSGALNEHNQGRLGNPADCLAKNVSKGHCVKDGKKQFYVSDEGRTEIG